MMERMETTMLRHSYLFVLLITNCILSSSNCHQLFTISLLHSPQFHPSLFHLRPSQSLSFQLPLFHSPELARIAELLSITKSHSVDGTDGTSCGIGLAMTSSLGIGSFDHHPSYSGECLNLESRKGIPNPRYNCESAMKQADGSSPKVRTPLSLQGDGFV
ncbi:hypothetical protein QBC45DRAFT_120144 [Copromyces sp. CBS 386.78]|nr:hypothetical protein QBC45DRAFT_120144 [Copromyces sp. CBS 386.78]